MSTVDNLIQKVDHLNFDQMLNQWIIPYGTKLVLALAIFFIGRVMVKIITKIIKKVILKSSKDPMLTEFVCSIVGFLGFLIVLVAALSQLGVNTSSIVALIGAAGLAIGLSLKNSLQNFAAGIMILLFKPFKKGDFIESHTTSGKVEKIGVMLLELKTPDNKTVLLPNGKVFSDKVTNYSMNNTRRIDLILDIAYDSDLKKAKNITEKLIQSHEKVLKNPEPTVVVGALAANSVQLYARPWVKTSDYWAVMCELTEQIKLDFDAEGIEIPFNKLDVNLNNTSQIMTEKTS